MSGILEKKKEQQLVYKVKELLYNKIDNVLESLISQEEIHEIYEKTIGNKFQIYNSIHDLFSDVKFERKKKEWYLNRLFAWTAWTMII